MKIIDYLNKYFEDVLVAAGKLNYKLKIHQGNTQKTYVAFLYSFLLNMCKSFVILIRQDDYHSLPIILRGILESSVDIINLTKDKDYFNVMRANFYDQKIKFLNTSRIEKCFLGDETAPSAQIIQNEIKKTQYLIDYLKSLGIKKMNIEMRFKKASLDSYYHYQYRYLSLFSHPSIALLKDVDIRSAECKKLLKLRVVGRRDLYHFMDVFTRIVFYTTVRVNSFYGYSKDHDMRGVKLSTERLIKRLDVLLKSR